MVQIGDDVGGIYDDNITIHQGRHFNTSINSLECFMVRPEQSVNCLVIQVLVLQCHAHFARKWTERTIIQFDHDMTSRLRPRVGLCTIILQFQSR